MQFPDELPYAAVEAALLLAFDIRDPQARSSFRARIIHFQRIGLAPSRPGKGKKIVYRREDLYRWAFAFELAEFRIDPRIIRIVVDAFWHDVRPYLLSDHSPDRFFFFYPFLIERELPWGTDMKGVPSASLAAKVIVGLSDIERMKSRASPVLTAGREFITSALARFGMINLGHVRRRVEAALSQRRE
jgi:hypothetical protein